MIYQQLEGCGGCFRPDKKRLGTLQSNPDYECYGESYIKCFWGLCDQQNKSVEAFVVKVDGSVITEPPRRTNRTFSQIKIEN